MDLVNALGYQDGAVISRVLLKNGGGIITLFAFDQGEGLSEHKAPFDAFVNVIEGETDITIAGQKHTIRVVSRLSYSAAGYTNDSKNCFAFGGWSGDNLTNAVKFA